MITQRIRALMLERGLNRAELARKTGIPYHRINPWFVRENAKPNGPDIEAVASALGVSVSFLVYGREPDPATARDWISQTYQQLDADRQRQLEAFVQFLIAQQDAPDRTPD